MNTTPRSKEFDDIYFSQEDGLAETEYVFLNGNNLPEAFAGHNKFTIAETGFGTGLNFLAVWDLFEKESDKGQRLDFISFEKHPLSKDVIKDALEPWSDKLGSKIDRMLEMYPLRIAGVHSICISENVFLTLIFDDVNYALPKLDGRGVNAWFLDGFNPAKNPDMWTPTVFENMARLSLPNATFSTFTAAGFVRRGLQDVGFEVNKIKGFSNKREMLTGSIELNDYKREKIKSIRNVAIVGGGLAGTSAAYWFKKNGIKPTTYEASDSLGAGASGNVRGMVNPRISKLRSRDADFYMQAYAMAIREMENLSNNHDIEFEKHGALHLMHNKDMEIRYPAMVENWGWHEDHAKIVSAQEASNIAGIKIEKDALYLPDGAAVSPVKLCTAYADGVKVNYNTPVTNITRDGDKWLVEGELYDSVILASAISIKDVAQAYELVDKCDLYSVRGQVSVAPSTPYTEELKTILNYRGYIAPARGGFHAVGSTFDRKETSEDILVKDHEEIISYMEDTVPSMKGQLVPSGGRASFRVSCKYRFPVFDRIASNMYVSTAHGSHGLISTIQASSIIYNDMCSSLRVYG